MVDMSDVAGMSQGAEGSVLMFIKLYHVDIFFVCHEEKLLCASESHQFLVPQRNLTSCGSHSSGTWTSLHTQSRGPLSQRVPGKGGMKETGQAVGIRGRAQPGRGMTFAFYGAVPSLGVVG